MLVRTGPSGSDKVFDAVRVWSSVAVPLIVTDPVGGPPKEERVEIRRRGRMKLARGGLVLARCKITERRKSRPSESLFKFLEKGKALGFMRKYFRSLLSFGITQP